MTTEAAPKIYVVEHLDSELGPWSSIEYRCIARECGDAGAQFNLTSVSEQLASLPSELQELEDASNFRAETRSVEELFADKKHRVCLLDPAAAVELEPADGDAFDVFVFGGILGMLFFFFFCFPRLSWFGKLYEYTKLTPASL